MLVDLLDLLRHLRRSPASAAAVVLTLSLTLGAGASIFAVVDSVLLTAPPFVDPHALVIVSETPLDDPPAAPRRASYATFQAWRERAGALATLEAFEGTNLTLTGLGAAERVRATDVTIGFLSLLGVVPERGRTFDASDAGQRVAVVSHRFWREKFGADPAAIGRSLVLGGQVHTIVGVLPDRVGSSLGAGEVWRPLTATPEQAASPQFVVNVLARLAANVSAASLAAVLDDVSRNASRPAQVVTAEVGDAIAGDAPRTLGLLAASAALATLIAFTNLAGLLIVRSIDRRRELAVRAALGARGLAIARQLVMESAALVVLGIVGGVLLALWITPAVARLVLQQFGDLANMETIVSWRVIGGLAAMASALACVCGLVPAWLVSRRSVVDGLRLGATAPPRELRIRRLLVTSEVALAFLLIVCVMLLSGSLLRILGVNPGFNAEGVLAAQVSIPARAYATQQQVTSFYTALQAALEERLGPRTTSIVNEIPLTSDGGRITVAPRPDGPGSEAVLREAGASYFAVMNIPVVAGRPFDARDSAVAPRVMVSELLAKRLFALEPAVGRQVWLAGAAQPAEIVGIVGDVAHRALDDPPLPTVYRSAFQDASRSSIIVVKSPKPPGDVVAAIREEVARLDRELPVYGVRSMLEVVHASRGVPARRVLMSAFIGFALLAVLLGGIGLFGVLSHDVARRRSELALRLALGAEPQAILRATLGQGALMVGAGLAVGGVLSLWAARVMSTMLFATTRWDLLPIAVAAVMLLAAGAVAALPAALRAARTDPLMALRAE